MIKEMEAVYPKSREEWRKWFQDNHNKRHSVWIVYYKRKYDRPTVSYSEAVDEALWFGWIDSKSKPLTRAGYEIVQIARQNG